MTWNDKIDPNDQFWQDTLYSWTLGLFYDEVDYDVQVMVGEQKILMLQKTALLTKTDCAY